VSNSDNTEKQNNLKINQLLIDLNSGVPAKISSSLKAFQVNGNISILKPLVELLKTDLSHDTEAEILEFLGDLKSTKVSEEIISILRDDNFLDQRQKLLSTIWNCKVDYSEYIAEFVEIACDGNFMEALECLTILENLDGPFQEQHILECHLHLKEYIEDTTTAKDPQKAQIMSEIALLIRDFDLNTDED
jgi:hypothetical protein